MSPATTEFEPLAWDQATPDILLARIEEANIVGMGGAGFPAARKITLAREHPPNIVIANGLETDPGVNADKELLSQCLDQVLRGVRIVARILTAKHSFLAVSEEKIAISLKASLNNNETARYIRPTFQNGAERELIEVLTGNAVKDHCFPAYEGYVVFNVHTLFAISQAIAGIPLSKRLVTVDKTTQWIELGTSIDSILGSAQPIRVGSYATGYRPRNNEKITATVNAISIDCSVDALPCIHCGWCSQACPRDLPVESMYSLAQEQGPNITAQNLLDRCNDCGACVAACPSNIHVLDYLRALRRHNVQELKRMSRATLAKARVESRNQRLHSQAVEGDTIRAERMQQQHKWK